MRTDQHLQDCTAIFVTQAKDLGCILQTKNSRFWLHHFLENPQLLKGQAFLPGLGRIRYPIMILLEVRINRVIRFDVRHGIGRDCPFVRTVIDHAPHRSPCVRGDIQGDIRSRIHRDRAALSPVHCGHRDR